MLCFEVNSLLVGSMMLISRISCGVCMRPVPTKTNFLSNSTPGCCWKMRGNVS